MGWRQGLRGGWQKWLALLAACGVAIAVALALAAASFERSLEEGGAPDSAPTGNGADPALVERGAYIARLGHCAGCHTARGGPVLAGGRALVTPFGTVYAGNLTPDMATGLGAWSANDFWRALHLGRSRDGRLLLPAFPYTHYTRVTRSDSFALFAYLRSLPAVAAAARPHELRFPYNTQAALALWRLAFFRPFTPAAAQADAAALPPLERGVYLVQGLGHCSACHAPRNAWGATVGLMTGSVMPGQRWYAPSLLPGQRGQGSPDETVALLKTGGSTLGRASGPMAAVVAGSMQFWSDADLHAAVLYLQSLPRATPQPAGIRAPDEAKAAPVPEGGRLYDKHCADCHGAQGQGVHGIYPALAGNATVLQPSAMNLVQIITHGGFGPTTAGNPRPFGMPPQAFSDSEMAAVISHIRTSWGNDAARVSDLEVWRLRN